MDNPSALPRLSPSLTLSLNSSNSSSLPSPKDGVLDLNSGHPNMKFPPDNIFKKPTLRRSFSCSDSRHPHAFPVYPHPSLQPRSFILPSKPQARSGCCAGVFRQRDTSSSPSVRDRTVNAQKLMHERYRPYAAKSRATPSELGIAARSLGLSSYSGMTLEDIEEVHV